MHHATAQIRPTSVIGPINERIYGSFIEHLGRAVYNGIYEPGHPLANEQGFRTDVIDLVKGLGVSAIRYPGGNFVSGFKWEDSVGPVDQRPTRLDLAWHSTETNEVGMHEFQDWLDLVGSELMLAVNLGTRGTAEALELLEYANLAQGTALTDRRAQHGRGAPFDVRMWCLGNEMDGPWQIGHRSAEDYGKIAAITGSAMKQFDPELELVACGSSSSSMPTFGKWERTVLTHAYDVVDYISCHAYYEDLGDTPSFLASGVDMDRFIATVTKTADHVRDVRRSNKTINISFDEWNIWYNTRFENVDRIEGANNWPIAPRLLEDVYNVTDAVVFGSLLISLLRHADRVTSASLAQLVNVIAPIMTEPGGPSWCQTTYYPFAQTSAHGRGQALDLDVASPTYDTDRFGAVPVVDAVAAFDEDQQRYTVFAVNRSMEEPTSLSIDVSALGGSVERASVSARVLHDDDLHAVNTMADPERVVLKDLPFEFDGENLVISMPSVSWAEVLIELR